MGENGQTKILQKQTFFRNGVCLGDMKDQIKIDTSSIHVVVVVLVVFMTMMMTPDVIEKK